MKKLTCLNCNTPLVDSEKYCHNCGQSVKESRLSIRALMSDLLSSIFNIDGRIVQTFKHMWWPAYLTKQFIAGKRKSYLQPGKFFLVMLVLHFIILTYTLSHSGMNFNSDDFVKRLHETEIQNRFDSLTPQILPHADSIMVDSLRKGIFTNRSVDSLDLFHNARIFSLHKYKILKKDAYQLTNDSLCRKYKVTSRWHKHAIQQYIRIDENRESSLGYMVGNLSWAVLFVVFAMALISWLLYIRNGYYYVEHAVLYMYYHAKVFFVLNIICGILLLMGDSWFDNEYYAGSQIIMIAYLLFTMKSYFQQGWIKTLIKFITILISYIILLTLLALIIALVGMIFF